MLAPLPLANGTVAAPSLTFGSDPDAGFYRIGANNIGIACGGSVKPQEWSATATTATVPVLTANGAVGAPAVAFASDTDTGLYRIGADNPAVAAGGVKVQEWSATGTAVTGTASVSGAATVTGLATLTGGSTSAGNHALTGSNPASTTGFTNTLTPMNLIKAWALVETDGAGNAAVLAGFNVASLTASGGSSVVQVNIANDLTGGASGTLVTGNSSGNEHWMGTSNSNSIVSVSAYDSSHNQINLGATARKFTVVILGAQ
jgi:hypothetical protein